MVVLSVVGVLVTLLLPTLASARARAKSVRCVSNVRQLGIGYTLFVGDHGMPSYFDNLVPWGVNGDWHTWMAPSHAENPRIRECPATYRIKRSLVFEPDWIGAADRSYRIALWSTELRGPRSVVGWVDSGYGINHWMRSMDSDPWILALYYRTEGSVLQPNQAPVFFDSSSFSIGPMASSPAATDLHGPGRDSVISMEGLQLGRHGRKGPVRTSSPVGPGRDMGPWVNNIVFYDGHVESARIGTLWKFHWHKDYLPPSIHPN